MIAAERQVIGWREWLTLQEFAATPIKAKVDTGAKTSALHAYKVAPFHKGEQLWVRFDLHPQQGNTDISLTCEAPVKDQRRVTDSGGHSEMRYVIETTLALRDKTFRAEITLTDRETMRFRMLLGRSALKNLYLVDSGKSFVLGGDKTQPPG